MFDILQVAEAARSSLPLYVNGKGKTESRFYTCPSCNGKLKVSDTKVFCVVTRCQGIHKLILELSGDLAQMNESSRDEWKQQQQRNRQNKPAKEPGKRPESPTGLNLNPGNLSEGNYKEFADSAISREIADKNIIRLINYNVIAKILGWKGYSHTAGWYAGGVDITTGKLRQDWQGQFKPDVTFDGSKYLTTKHGYDAIAPYHPGFDWVAYQQQPNQRYLITEGIKKALSYICRYLQPALGVLGVNNFFRDGDFIPNIKRLANPGNTFDIAYDSDWESNKNVLRALVEVADKFIEKGCLVNILTWDSQYKGLDDAIVAGVEIVATPYKEWIEKNQSLIDAIPNNNRPAVAKPVNKLDIEVKGKVTKLIPMTDGEKEAYNQRKKAADIKDAIASINSQLHQLDPYKASRKQVKSIIISDHADHAVDTPIFCITYVHKEAIYHLLDYIQYESRVCLKNLEKAQLHNLLRQYGQAGVSNFGRRDLLGGPNPQKTRKNDDGDLEEFFQVDITGEYLKDADGQLIPEPKYSDSEWEKLQVLVEVLKSINLNNHLDLFTEVDAVNIEVMIDHENKEYIAWLINQRYNQSMDNPCYTCLFRLETLPGNPFVLQREWEQNSIDSVATGAKKTYFDEWKRLTDFTAEITRTVDFVGNDEVLKSIDLTDGNVHMVSAGCGTGKTTGLNDKIFDLIVNRPILPSGNPIKIICNSHRLNLIANTKYKLVSRLIDHYRSTGMSKEDATAYVDLIVMDAERFKNTYGNFFGSWSNDKGIPLVLYTCTDSLPTVLPKMPKTSAGEKEANGYDFRKEVVMVFDELDAVIKHTVTGSTCRDNRPNILGNLDGLLENCLGAYGLSGTLNESCKRLFEGIGKKVITYKNNFKQPSKTIEYSLGVGNYDESNNRLYLEQLKRSFILSDIYEALRNGENILIPGDSKNWNAILEELIKINVGEHIMGCRIDAIEKVSRNESRKNMVNEIMADPVNGILNNKIQYLIYNSSAESGVDISMPPDHRDYFKKIFCFNFGVIGTAGTIQLLKRWRHDAEILLWSIPGRVADCDFPEIPQQDNLFDYKDGLRRVESGLLKHEQVGMKYQQIANELKFVSSVERRHTRLCLEYMLEKHGYILNHTYGSDTGDVASEGRKITEERTATNILTADTKYVDADNLDVVMQNNTSEDDIWALTLAFYAKKWGYSKDEITKGKAALLTPDFIIHNEYRERQFYDHCKNLCLVDVPEKELKLLHTKTDKAMFAKDYRLMMVPISCLKRSGIADLIQRTDKLSLSDEIITKIKSWARDKRNQENWKLLCGSYHNKRNDDGTITLGSDKLFTYQLKKILKGYFGLVCKVKSGEMVLIPGNFQPEGKNQLWKGIEYRLFKAKVKEHIRTNGRLYPEVATDDRFEVEKDRIIGGDCSFLDEPDDSNPGNTTPHKVESASTDIILDAVDVVQMPPPQPDQVDILENLNDYLLDQWVNSKLNKKISSGQKLLGEAVIYCQEKLGVDVTECAYELARENKLIGIVADDLLNR